MSGPLAGLRVLELGSLVAGPFAGRLLADLGAEVVKVESPRRPDPLRGWGHRLVGGRSLWWAVQARNKRTVTLDLNRPEAAELLRELVVTTDVVIENFRPGTLERWGLGWDRLSEVNPGLVLVRVSGYGQDGPNAAAPAFASVAEAESGLRSLNGNPGQEPPPRMGVSLGDSLAGLYAAFGALAALRERETSGLGQVVDVSLLESCLAFTESAVPEFDLTGYVRGPGGSGLSGMVAGVPSNAFRSRDGRWVVVAAGNDRLFRDLAGALGRPELADDRRFRTASARGEHREECERVIADWVGEREAGEVVAHLRAHGVACGPVRGVDEVAGDVQLAARGALPEHVGPDGLRFRAPGVVPVFSRTPGAVRWTGGDRPGAANDEVFARLAGVDAERLAALRDRGAM